MMEDDTDIYEDLPSIEIQLDENFVGNQTECNTREYAELKKQIAELTVKLDDFRKVNENLEVNLASLLKTAKAEITRKDKMIEDLRKQLDDLMFKRGSYFKTNDRVCKPTFVDNVTIPRQRTDQISLPLNQNKHELAETDSSYNLTKNSNLSKSTLTPLTVFGERLLKRIAEEQTVEKRGKQPSRFGCNNSRVPTVEGYLVESDKENSSATDVKPSRTKETQSSSAKEYSEREQFMATNCLTEERNGIDTNDVFPQKSMRVTNIVDINEITDVVDGGKNDGTDRTMSIKRIQFDVKEGAPRTTNPEMREDVDNVFYEKREHTKTKRFECLEKYSYPRHTAYSDMDRNCYSSVQQQNRKRSHRSFTDTLQTNQHETDGRVAKRHCKSAERLSITIDDGRSSSVECRRIKQNEDRRTNKILGDRRSRGRQPFCESSRDEKYIRNKSNKYNKYRERSTRRYDISPDNTNGSKATCKRESRDTRNIEKSEKSARSMSKRSDRSEDNECRSKERLKDVDRATRRDKSDGEKMMSRARNCGTFKSVKAIDTNKRFEKNDRRGFTGDYETTPTTTTKLDDSSRKCQINRSRDSKRTDANDIALESNCNERVRLQDGWTNGGKLESSFVSVDLANTSIVTRAATVTTTTNAIATCFATVVPPNEQCCENIGNVECNETVENVENIEKFIRNYNTTDGDYPKNGLLKTNDTSKPAEEHGSTANHVVKGKTNFVEQRDTIRSDDIKSIETSTKLEAVESKDAFHQVVQGSTRNDTEESEITTIPALVENAKSNEAFQCNYLVDLTADKASFNARTEEGLSNSNAICNISSSSSFQISKPGCNGNVDGGGGGGGDDKDKNNDKTSCINVSVDVDADKTNSNCDYSVSHTAKGNDDDHDRDHDHDHDHDHERHGNINVHKETVEKNHKTVRNKKETSKEEGRVNLAETVDVKIGNEEGKVNKEKKENSEDATEQKSCGTEKSSINYDGINKKNTSTNVHGKVIVFVRRKKPVCLVNSNANMTVLINNSQNINIS